MANYGVQVWQTRSGSSGSLTYSVTAPNPQDALAIGKDKARKCKHFTGKLSARITGDPLALGWQLR